MRQDRRVLDKRVGLTALVKRCFALEVPRLRFAAFGKSEGTVIVAVKRGNPRELGVSS